MILKSILRKIVYKLGIRKAPKLTKVEQCRMRGVKIGENVDLVNAEIDYCFGHLITIGNNVTITNSVVLAHDASTKKELGYSKIGCVDIGDNVFIGYGCIVLPNVKIGNKVIVGAGTVISKDIPDNDYHLEQEALKKALLHYNDLNMEGLILLAHDNIRKTHDNIDNNNNNNDTDNIFNKNHILAVTLGSQLSNDTFDVHFEKARWDVDGAYTVINNEFAKYIRDKYPHIKFINREDDMGIEGLRKSKESYYPHHMIEKSMAILQEV